MRAEIDEQTGLIGLEAPTTAAPLARQIPGARHDSKRQLWLLPLSWASCVTARGVLGQRLEVGPVLADWALHEVTNRIGPSLALRTAANLGHEGLGLVLDWVEGENEASADIAAGRVTRHETTEDFLASLADDPENDSAGSEGERLASSPPRLQLRPYQRAGAAFLATAGSALLGDEMRLGKTPTAIRAMQMLCTFRDDVEALPLLVVCPNSVKRVWRDMLQEWWPDARVAVAGSGTATARKAVQAVADGDADILVINYEAVPNLSRLSGFGSIELQGCTDCDPLSTRAPSRCERTDKELNLVPWRAVIADEVHRAKTPKAKVTRALWAIADKATYRFGLTGTPPEDPGEFWAVMRFVSPNEFAGKTTWVDRYVLTIPNFYSGFRTTVGFKPETREEMDRIVHPRLIRRTREMVFPDDLPPMYMPRYVELTGKQKKAYDTFRKELLVQVDNGVIWTSNPLTKLQRLRQLASAYGEAVEGGGMVLTEPSSKLDVFEEVLEELGPNEPVVVFAESRQLINLAGARMEKAGVRRYGYVTGGQTPEERADTVALFQNGMLNMLLCTVAAGGEGITLDAADTAIFLQRPWSSQLNVQAEARIQMPGVGKNTTIIEIITSGSVDSAVSAVLRDKADKLEELVQDRATLEEWLR